uniref:Uncharacterized protein n=1 Tax=Physcomitrium patens TaxID=3218 RepID=A0A2K1IVL8_PHYPA|nr:hypothetical protein PHYPA_025266 [Physcomitrium patens]
MYFFLHSNLLRRPSNLAITCLQCQKSPASGTLQMLRAAPLDFSVIPVPVSGRCLRECLLSAKPT